MTPEKPNVTSKELAKEIILAAGRPVTPRWAAEQMKSRGYEFRTPNASASLRTMMCREREVFVEVGRGLFVVRSERTQKDLAKEVLREAKEPMHVCDIVRGMQLKGYVWKAKYPEETLKALMNREKRVFERVGDGRFALKR